LKTNTLYLRSFYLLLLFLCISCRPQAQQAEESLPANSLPWVTEAVNATNTQRVLFQSQLAGSLVSYHVFLPAAYHQEPSRRFPVLYWLHGSGGGQDGIPLLVNTLNRAMTEGLIKPFIIAFPNGLPYGMWSNDKAGRQPVENILIRELIPHLDASFRTLNSRSGRIIEGFSMGGYGAVRLGFSYPQLFGGISMWGAGPLQLDFSVVSPANQQLQPLIFSRVYGNDMAYFETLSPWRIAEKKHQDLPPNLPIRLFIGTADYSLIDNRNFHQHLRSLGIAHHYQELEGAGHIMPQLLQAVGSGNWSFYNSIFTE
jgi:enterochelin esterase-like enzyme